MDADSIAVDAAELALTLLGLAFPPALPFLGIAKAAVPAFMAAKPYIVSAVQEGRSAIAAAKVAAPTLVPQIQALAEKAALQGHIAGPTPAIHLENITRDIFTIQRMTTEEEAAWMDRATPNVGDSKFGG